MKTELEILKPTDDNYASTFEVNVTFMHGDADAYTYERFFYTKKEEVLDFVNKLNALQDNYHSFRPDNEDKEAFEVIEDWPYDLFSDGECKACLRTIRVYWYDENHVKHDVNVQ